MSKYTKLIIVKTVSSVRKKGVKEFVHSLKSLNLILGFLLSDSSSSGVY